MTAKEAVEALDNVLSSDYHYDESLGYQLTSDDFEWLEMAKQALEKQIPKKPKITVHKCRKEDSSEFANYKITHCPCCFDNAEIGYFDSLVDLGTKYCRRCGQALDWSEENA